MKVLNFGSLNIDNVYAVDHFVRAGETLSSTSLKKHVGGKGLNQTVALARSGSQVYMAGKIGNDGAHLLEVLKKEGVNVDHIMVADYIDTGHAIIQVDKNGQNCILLYGGSNLEITREDVDEVLKNFSKGDFILLQNEISNLPYIIKKASEQGMTIALNPSPIDDDLVNMEELALVDWFILNEVEGLEISGKKDPEEICSEILRRYPGAHVMLTLGSKGAMFRDATRSAEHGIYDVPVVDTTAAGDTFTGYFLTGVAEGLEINKVLELASKASSLAVTKAGASNSIPMRNEVEETDMKLC
ncbi:MAG: ribokinase [Ruminococcaceae bacterium]|nr:ribokinase [Oscillospiraceae bacterium]